MKIFVLLVWLAATPRTVQDTQCIQGEWSSWSTCNTTCGYGTMNRTRNCITNNGAICLGILYWKNCYSCDLNGKSSSACLDTEFMPCNISNEGSWYNWSPWSTCNIQGSSRFMNRSRSCNNTCASCVGNDTEVTGCLSFESSWGKWSNWSNCNVSYGYGFINRTRDCNVSNDMKQCSGKSTEVKECFENKTCDDVCTQWSSWSLCSVSCGDGFTKRSRICNLTKGFEWCSGEITDDVKLCSSEITCSASWGKWSNWSNCNVSYGFGFINRTRDCNVSNDMKQCSGNSTEVKECFENKTCDDVCTQWSIWSKCNVSCGDGFTNRSRNCNTTKHFQWCSSNLTDFRHCVETTTCKGQWATWSECSVTCGIGTRSSFFSSENATNVSMIVENCVLTNCPVDGMWGEWEDLGCSKTCNGGMKTLKRSCNNPSPANFGRNCMGFSDYALTCDTEQICPVNGNWSMWSPWSSCSQPCLGGIRFRVRDCSNPTPKYNGLLCQGDSKEIVDCPRRNCKSAVVNLNLYFMDEDYINQYSQLTGDPSLALKDKIKIAIKNFYGSRRRNVTFNVVLHSVKDGSDLVYIPLLF